MSSPGASIVDPIREEPTAHPCPGPGASPGGSVDVYLDDSRRGAGALHVVPGSQVRRTDACALAETHGWEPPGAIEVELEAGDVLGSARMLRGQTTTTEANPAARIRELREGCPYPLTPAEMRQHAERERSPALPPPVERQPQPSPRG